MRKRVEIRMRQRMRSAGSLENVMGSCTGPQALGYQGNEESCEGDYLP